MSVCIQITKYDSARYLGKIRNLAVWLDLTIIGVTVIIDFCGSSDRAVVVLRQVSWRKKDVEVKAKVYSWFPIDAFY